ncbi:MAG TPA: insulinase family protein, partial [Armatimonadetes bacterium]|nr:insulinase family protein [Armatimonadota bacterium]
VQRMQPIAHPYRWSVIGYQSDLEAITRDELYSYYKRYYAPNNAVLVLVGDFGSDDALELIRKHFGDIEPGESAPEPRTQEPAQRGERRVTVRRQAPGRYVFIAYHIPEIEHPDMYPLMVLTTVLSYGRSSRLYRNLVEGNIAVWAYAHANRGKDPTLAWINAQARDGITNEQLERALLSEIESVQQDGITERELEKAINQTQASFVYEQEGVSHQAHRIGYYETLVSYKYLDEFLERIRSVTREDVQRVAQQYFIEDNRTIGYFVPSNGTAEAPPVPAMPHPPCAAFHIATYQELTTPMWNAGQFCHPTSHLNPMCFASDTPVRMSALNSHASNSGALKFSGETSRHVLDNGLTVLVHECHNHPTVSIYGSMKAGSARDPAPHYGLANFVAGMLPKGTGKRTWEQIAEEIDFVGARFGTGAGRDTAGFNAHCIAEHLPTVMDVIADVVRNPSFPDEELEKHRIQLITQLKTWDDDPWMVAEKMLTQLIYPTEHPYHHRVQGEVDTVQNFTRDMLIEFHRQWFHPEGTIIVIAGDVDTDEAIAIVERYFGDWERGDGACAELELPSASLVARCEQVVVPIMDKSQVAVMVGHRGISRCDDDYYALNVFNCILGGSAGIGRLFNRVRGIEGLAYSVWSHIVAGLGAGPFIAGAGVDPKNVERALDSIRREIALMRDDEPPTKQELNDAINYIIGSFAFRIETNSGMARTLMDVELFGLGLDYPKRHAEIYRAITLEQVMEVAQRHIHPNQLAVAIAGPWSASE